MTRQGSAPETGAPAPWVGAPVQSKGAGALPVAFSTMSVLPDFAIEKRAAGAVCASDRGTFDLKRNLFQTARTANAGHGHHRQQGQTLIAALLRGRLLGAALKFKSKQLPVHTQPALAAMIFDISPRWLLHSISSVGKTRFPERNEPRHILAIALEQVQHLAGKNQWPFAVALPLGNPCRHQCVGYFRAFT